MNTTEKTRMTGKTNHKSVSQSLPDDNMVPWHFLHLFDSDCTPRPKISSEKLQNDFELLYKGNLKNENATANVFEGSGCGFHRILKGNTTRWGKKQRARKRTM